MFTALLFALSSYALAFSEKAVNFSTSIGSNGAYENNLVLCNTTWSRANATGIYGFDPDTQQGTYSDNSFGVNTKLLPQASWALAIADQTDSNASNYGLEYGLYFSTGGANYSDDIHRGYDVCAIMLDSDQLFNNTILRGQSDNGSCYQTFDAPCITALQTAVQTYTGWYDSSTPSNQNLTAVSLPTVCDRIARTLNSNLPSECGYFINSTTDWVDTGFALSQSRPNNVSVIDDSCHINGDNSTYFSNIALVELRDYSDEFYDYLTSSVLPIITIYMPTANSFVSSSNDYINSILTCVHINHFNAGSRITPALPAATAIDYGNERGLGGGVIAGIVVSSVIGAILLALLILFSLNCCNIRRRKALSSEHALKSQEKGTSELMGEERGMPEMSPQSYKSTELPSMKVRTELDGIDKKVELEDHRPIAEMPGDMPSKTN